MTFYTQSSNGAAVPCNPYSTEEERRESEQWENICRSSAYSLNKKNGSGKHTPLLFKVK